MLRNELRQTIQVYRELWVAGADRGERWQTGEAEAVLGAFRDFIDSTPGCFQRETAAGHVTGSALVASPDLNQVLLTLHGKLGKWLQLGGHADGNHQPHAVALREAEEESGLTRLRFLAYESRMPGARQRTTLPWPLPFDFDAHEIPAHKAEPAHIHYDVRYVIIADPTESLVISSESKDLRWFPLAEARRRTDERSMHRQFDKLDWLRGRLHEV